MPDGVILLVEDAEDIVELVKFHLERDGFKVAAAGDGETGWREARLHRPDLVLLDLMLPRMHGLEVCRKLKQAPETQGIPVIILTARGEETDIVAGLEMGADDYIVKPFRVRELTARVRAVLRRAEAREAAPSDAPLRAGPLALDRARHEATIEGRPLALTLAEFRILEALVSRPGRVFTRDQLLDRISDGTADLLDRNIDVHVRAIRKKLGSASALLVTVRGIGYKCQEATSDDA